MKTLVTGGAGFIGSNFVRYLIANTDDEITVIDPQDDPMPFYPAMKRDMEQREQSRA